MKKKYNLKKKSEIDPLFKEGIKTGNSYFTIYKKENFNNVNFRFAISIGRKFGIAVKRNKIKRQIRSILRDNQLQIDQKNEFVIVIKPKANSLMFNEISEYIVYLLKKLKIMENKNEKI